MRSSEDGGFKHPPMDTGLPLGTPIDANTVVYEMGLFHTYSYLRRVSIPYMPADASGEWRGSAVTPSDEREVSTSRECSTEEDLLLCFFSSSPPLFPLPPPSSPPPPLPVFTRALCLFFRSPPLAYPLENQSATALSARARSNGCRIAADSEFFGAVTGPPVQSLRNILPGERRTQFSPLDGYLNEDMGVGKSWKIALQRRPRAAVPLRRYSISPPYQPFGTCRGREAAVECILDRTNPAPILHFSPSKALRG